MEPAGIEPELEELLDEEELLDDEELDEEELLEDELPLRRLQR